MRRSDKMQAKIVKAASRSMAAMAVLLLAVWPAMASAQAKTPAASPQRRTAPGSPSTAKKPAARPEHNDDWLQEALKDPDLMDEVGHLSQRLVNEVQLPAARTESRILPRLSDSMDFYIAIPNFGETLHQAQQIFQQELRDSAPLRQFMRKNKLDADEPKFEEELQKLYELSEYMGNEFVVTGAMKGAQPDWVLITEVRKPGLKDFIEKMRQELDPGSKQHMSILDPQKLAGAPDSPGQEPVILVRPDFLLMGTSASTLRAVSSQIDNSRSSFVSTPLGRRVGQSYQSGASIVAAVVLRKFFELIPQDPPQTRLMLEKTGFLDLNYALLVNKMTGKDSSAQADLVFNGPRRGVASWVASPAPLGALDFLSPKAYVAEAIRLKPPAQILDDIIELAGPQASAMLPQLESQFNINLKQDILSKLGGEIAFEIQTPPVPRQDASGHALAEPSFKVVLSVSDAAGLQQSLKRLLALAPMESGQRVEDGVTFYTLSSPSAAAGRAPEFNYFFADGYLVIASSRALAQEALQFHRGGESLARSSQIAAQGRPVKASMVVYQNSSPFLAALAKQMPGDIAGVFSRLFGGEESAANVMFGYADETSLRGNIKSKLMTDASFGLMAAAIAIPNLMRSRSAANEAAAAASLRTVNTAQVTYSVSYPRRGFAPSLAVLGPGPGGDCSANNVSAEHACLLDNILGNPDCTAGKWCEHSGYRFSMRGICQQARCSGYVVTATPISDAAGKKNFCATVDTVVRSHEVPPLAAPLTAAACKAWAPVK
jgi:hypothetical protein